MGWGRIWLTGNGECEISIRFVVGEVGRGKALLMEGSVGSASIESPVADGFKRPSERRKHTRSLQPNGRLTAVGAGPFKRLNERSTQNRESHLRGAVGVVTSVTLAVVDGVVSIAGVVRRFEVLVVPGPVGVGFKVQSVSESEQRLDSKETAGGGGNQCGGGSPGGGGCHGISGLKIGNGPGSIHGFLGSTGDIGGGGIQGLWSLGFGGGGGGRAGEGGG